MSAPAAVEDAALSNRRPPIIPFFLPNVPRPPGRLACGLAGFLLAGVLLALPAMAQSDDAAYCAKLADLALRYTGSAGGNGRLTPDLSTTGAINDCNKGNTAAGIAVLEKTLRSQGFTLPKR